jgi:hypothetical protein
MGRGGIGRDFLAFLVVAWLAMPAPAPALSGLIETNVFAVPGVEVDVTSGDAASAKNQALMDVQVKAFFMLVERLASPEVARQLRGMSPQEIAPFLKSLSIEKETSAPGRYIGTFTVRFLPSKVEQLLSVYGVHVPASQADPIVVLPVLRGAGGSVLWEDNLWRKAWIDLRAEQSLVPVIVPLGDIEDTEAMTAEDALNGDPFKLEAIRRRYGASSVVVAVAEPDAGGGLHVVMTGDTRIGRLKINKVFTAEDGAPESAAASAVARIHATLVATYKNSAAAMAATAGSQDPFAPQAIAVAVPFASPTEWNGIRSRIISTPYVTGVDVSTLAGDGAVIRLTFTNSLPMLQENLQRAGLRLAQYGDSWVIQPL